VVASERASFAYPEVTVGIPTIVGALRLPARIGWQHAMELLLTGDRIDAARAKEIGLAGWVVPHEELLPTGAEVGGATVPGRTAGRPGHQGDGRARAGPAHGRRDPIRRDHAQGRADHRGRRRGCGRVRRTTRSGLARTMTRGVGS